MSRWRNKLLPIVGPLGIAAGLAVVTSLGEDEPLAEPLPEYTEHTLDPERAPPTRAPVPVPPPPIDRPRCLASMTVQELGRQLMVMNQAASIAELYRDEATPEIAREYLQGLADSAAALPPGIGRSRLLTMAADGLVRLDRAPAARDALEASRNVPPPLPTDYGFERSKWRGEAAAVAARLDDHALAMTLVEQDPDARAALALHYAETKDESRARALLEPVPEHASLGWRMDEAGALAGVGELKAALALADGIPRDAPLVHLRAARVLLEQDHHEQAASVIRDAAEHMPEREEPGERLSNLVVMARALHEAGDPVAAERWLGQVRTELLVLGDHYQALGPWAGLIDGEHRAGATQQAWQDMEKLEAIGLADMGAAPMTRVLLLSREGRLDEALAVINETASMPYPLAYAQIHVRMRERNAALERKLDDGLRMFCSGR